jgi:hypothetical protein
MQRTLLCFLLSFLSFCGTAHAAKDILLRLQPNAGSPVIAKVTASEKVLLDAAPAPSNATLGWRQLALPTPFEGYVPIAAMSKNFEIIEGTPVHYLPTSESAAITHVESGDRYEVIRAKEEWATVRFSKDITGYFIDDATEEVAFDLTALPVPKIIAQTTTPSPRMTNTTPEPVAIPAPRARVNPDEPIAQIDPKTLPPENVSWQAAEARAPAQPAQPTPHTSSPDLDAATIMVPAAQTQARETTPDLGPAKTPRLLTGKLVREINVDGPTYPIRLQSPEGRLIAYVDFSAIYISDLAPYLEQKVYIRGQIHPLPNTQNQLVILAESLRLAE